MQEMAGRDHPPSLKDLEDRLKAARAQQREARGENGQGKKSALAGSGLGFGLRIAADLLAGLLIGVGLGLLLDNWLGTKPLMLVVFLFLGGAAGMLNVYRTATGKGYAVGYRKDAEDEEEPGNDPGEKVGGDKA